MQNQDEKANFYRPKWQLKPKSQPHPARRWCHTATTYGSHLYVMGGRLAESAKTREYVYRIHCQTLQCQPILLSDNPMMRESHSCALVNDSLYVLFGINKASKVLSDCLQIKVTPNSLIWQRKNQISGIDPRESHMSVVLDDRYILIYGGIDSQEKLLDDFYLYDLVHQSWRKIQKVEGTIQGKVGGTLINIKNQIYLFGGQISDENQYSNQIYKIQISHYTEAHQDHQTQIQISKLNPKGSRPLPRSQFASVVYKDRYLIILGGQGPSKDNGEPVKLLSDIWAFDTQKLTWEEILPENPQAFKPRSSFTANIYKQSLIVFGGLVSMKDFKSSDQIFVLNLNTESEKKPMCNLCKSSFKVVPKQQIQVQNTKAIINSPKFSTGFSTIFAISRTIEDPFAALGTLLHSLDSFQVQKCSMMLHETKLAVRLKNIDITEFEWKHILGSYEFIPLIQQRDNRVRKALQKEIRFNLINYLSYSIKNSCFRLGNELLLSWVNGRKQLQICLMNKFGVYHTQNVNSSQNDSSPSQASIILQFLKEHQIDIMRLLEASMSIYVTSLKYESIVQHKQQIYFGPNTGDIVCRDRRFRDYLQIAFANKLSFSLAVDNRQIGFSQPQKFIPIGQNQHEKWPQQNNYPDLFQEILTYVHPGNSIILVYQLNKLMHSKQIKSFEGIAIEFHLTKKIEPKITFSDVLPSAALIEAITTVVKHLSTQPPIRFKRNKSFKREQVSDICEKGQFWQNPTKMVKKNSEVFHQNEIEVEIIENISEER